jgi:predicted ABC-type ATPase
MRRVLETHGIHAVQYSNGAKHGLAEYSEMAMRTTTAKAYNSGTLGSTPDVGFYEIFDGPNCGLSFHEDPTLAMGLVVDKLTAETYLISHPNCRRSFGPRPDVTSAAQAKETPGSVTPEQTQAQLLQDAGRGDKEARAALRGQARADRLAARQAKLDARRPAATDTQSLYSKGGVYTPERQALHESYMRQQMEGAVRVEEPEFRVMGGGAASGKSSIIESGDVTLPRGHVLVNPDDAKAVIPEYQQLVAAKDTRASSFVHEESSDMAKQLTRESLSRGHHTVLDGIGNGAIDDLAAKIAKGRAAGAKRIVGDYVTVDTDEAVRRAIARGEATGRFVPETTIRHGHELVSKTFYQATKRDDMID